MNAEGKSINYVFKTVLSRTFGMKLRYIYICVLLILMGCNSKKTESEKLYTGTIEDTISNQTIYSIVEDQYGYIWLGTARGLNRYNGDEYTQFFFKSDGTGLPINFVLCMLYDSRNRLWIGTGNGIVLYEDGKFKEIQIDGSSKFVAQIIEDKLGRIIINTSNEICILNQEENLFEEKLSYFSNFPIPTFLNLTTVDSYSRVWVATLDNICVYDSEFKLIKEITIPSAEKINDIYLSPFEELWISYSNGLSIVDINKIELKENPASLDLIPKLTTEGIQLIREFDNRTIILKSADEELFIYDFLTGETIKQGQKNFPFSSPDFDIIEIFSDSQKNLWFGSRNKGFEIVRNVERLFNENYILENALSDQSIVQILESEDRKVWFISSNGRVYKYDLDLENIKKVVAPFQLDEESRLFFDSKKNIWLVNKNKLYQCKTENDELIIKNEFTFNESLKVIEEDDDGKIWVAGYGEYIYYKSKRASSFEQLQIHEPKYNLNAKLLKISTGELLVLSFQNDVFLFNPKSLKKTYLNIQAKTVVEPFFPVSAFEDSNGKIWIGTVQNGLFEYDPENKLINKHLFPKLENNIIIGIIGDTQGYLWLTTENGIYKFDPIQKKEIVYYIEDGIGGNQFNNNSLESVSNGELYFGGTHGITQTNPTKPISNVSGNLIIERIISDKTILYEASNHSNLVDEIKIKNWFNSFSIHFSPLNYDRLKNYRFAYKLENYNSDWVEAGKNRQVNFYKIPSGNYTFMVKAFRNDIEDENTITARIKLELLPTVWGSNKMILVYSVLLLSFLYFIFRIFRAWKREKDKSLEAERKRAEALRINELNFNYFINISHEFRTPLTMIRGPLSILTTTNNLDGESGKLLSIIERNVDKMLRLVNQFLDFNDLREREINLHKKDCDIIPEIIKSVDLFSFSLKEKDLSIKLDLPKCPVIAHIDSEKIEKSLSNILSNSIKYTPSGGSIEVFVKIFSSRDLKSSFNELSTKNKEWVKVDIKDSGIGIPEKELDKVFDRFYQVNQSNGLNYYGTGIGLNFTKKIIEAHDGRIKAFNHPSGGTLISFIIPLKNISTTSDGKSSLNREAKLKLDSEQAIDKYDPINKFPLKEKVLIVDDDPEIIHFLKIILKNKYEIQTAFDADTAIIKLENQDVDLIISDVLMPGMSGYDFCRFLKSNLDYCHIPIVLLTAKSTTDEQVKGLSVGAEAYITKPFDAIYLKAIVQSQLENRKKIRKVLTSTSINKKEINKMNISSQDKWLINEFYKLMDEGLDDPELNINQITDKLNISRTKFYYKVKSLTGETPSQFFKIYKLNKATELIKTGKYNISEIAFMTGFNTLSHFSLSFKKQFGVPPSEYD